MAYRFTMPPQDVASLPAYLAREFGAVASGFNDAADSVQLNPLGAAPKKPRMGLIVCADGTSWDPGAGAGIYWYTGSAWSKL
jgi:hypothetical protein